MSTPVLVPLTRGMFAIIDAEDAADVLEFRWAATFRKTVWYAVRSRATSEDRSNGTNEYLHRRVSKASKNVRIDHKNNDGLDCQKGNLRVATQKQNLQNMRTPCHNTSGFKGVSWDKTRKKWRAYIVVSRKQTMLGRFDTPEDAARIYDAAARRLFGEFAKTNFTAP